MAGFRKERIGDLILGFLSEELRRMSDPRLELVTLTAAEVTRDLKIAKVYWSIPAAANLQGDTAQPSPESAPLPAAPSEAERAEIGRALTGAAGYLKRRIGEELELRNVPNLNFVFDASVITGTRIDALLRSISGSGRPTPDK